MASSKRPSEFLNQMMNVFKGLEKKLDKLQGDVDYQGQTLTDLKLMVTNMTGLSDLDIQELSQSPRAAGFVPHETQTREHRKVKKLTQEPSSNKKPKSLPKFGLSVTETKKQYVKKSPSSPMKQSSRVSKADAPRKTTTTLMTQNNKMEKARKRKKSLL